MSAINLKSLHYKRHIIRKLARSDAKQEKVNKK